MLFDSANALQIPLEMRQIPRWIAWREVPLPETGKTGKEPVNPHNPHQHGSSTNPKTWTSFAHAVGCTVASHGTLGLAFVFTQDDPICGLDLDFYHYPSDAPEQASQRAILARCTHTYAERSPSGNGVHVYGYGVPLRSTKSDWGELYGHSRFFTVT